jgi:hypothetical protein
VTRFIMGIRPARWDAVSVEAERMLATLDAIVDRRAARATVLEHDHFTNVLLQTPVE